MSSILGPLRDHQIAVPLVRVESEPQPGSNRRGRTSLSGTQVGQGSAGLQPENAPSLNSRTASERGSLFAHVPRSPSRLRRSDSLTSLPVHVQRTETDLTNGNDFHHGHGHASPLPAVASLQNVRQALQRVAHSDPSQVQRNNSDSPNNSPGHAAPLRLFWPLHRLHSREEPFVPIDPYRHKFHFFSTEELEEQFQRRRTVLTGLPVLLRHAVMQTYRHILLRLPSMYFTRVSRLFEEAEVTRLEIQRMIDGVAQGLDLTHDWTPPNVSPTLARFKASWEEFIEVVIQEWKTLNVVSALLLSALLTMFQIDDANNQPVTRAASLISLICATWSLIFGGVYIMRFRTMRSMYKASSFAQEAQKTTTNIFWNVWVLLALPAVWLAWSMITFFAAILAFVWTSGSANDNPEPPPPRIELIPRVIITALFALGALYFVLVLQSFKAYGAPRSRKAEIRAQEAAPRTVPDAGANGNANVNTNSLGLNLDGGSSGAQGESRSGVSDASWPRVELEKGEVQQVQAEELRHTRRGSPGLGGLDL